MNKKAVLIVLGVFLLTLGAVWAIWTIESRQSKKQVVAVSNPPPRSLPVPKVEELKPRVPVPAFQSEAALATLPPTLSPEMFAGSARAGYTIAREIPDTLAQLPCYCHCDKSIGHKSLHSCFADDHGANCGVCQSEAMTAYKLKKEKNFTAAEIREKIIEQYSKQY